MTISKHFKPVILQYNQDYNPLSFTFQKFRFCGEGDCPDWVLAEIHSNLAILSSDQLKEVAHQVARCIVEEEVPVN